MTFLVRSFGSLRSASKAIYRPTATFHTSASRWALSEHDRDDESRHIKVEYHKEESLKKQKDGKGEWKHELASQSEQVIAGEKSNLTMDEMRKLGEKKAEEGRNPSNTSETNDPAARK